MVAQSRAGFGMRWLDSSYIFKLQPIKGPYELLANCMEDIKVVSIMTSKILAWATGMMAFLFTEIYEIKEGTCLKEILSFSRVCSSSYMWDAYELWKKRGQHAGRCMNLEIKGRFCAGNTHFKWRAADVDSENQEARQGSEDTWKGDHGSAFWATATWGSGDEDKPGRDSQSEWLLRREKAEVLGTARQKSYFTLSVSHFHYCFQSEAMNTDLQAHMWLFPGNWFQK